MEFQEVIEVDDYSNRTDDVKTQGSFASLMISPSTIVNLQNHGYRVPSPVQMKAIPTGLTGLDMLVQAKSGTGKTLVFTILAVENLNLQSYAVQKLIIAPTREIAGQIKDTIKMIADSKTRIALLVGGTPVNLDVQTLKKGVHIVVGTSGRVCQMVQSENLDMSSIDLFVLDEADKLMEECFRKDINYLFSALPPSRQVAVFSATYPRDLDKLLAKFMRDASLVRLNSGDVQLIGMKQYVTICCEPILAFLVRLLKSVHFNQALVFCNFHQQCEPTCVYLENAGFLSACIHAQLTQTQRDSVIEKLKHNKLKVLVSTDLSARGIDAVNVDIVINLGLSFNVETYFHRIGRAARFGGYGAAVTILSDSREIIWFKTQTKNGGLSVRLLDIKGIPSDLATNQTYFELCPPFKDVPLRAFIGRNHEIKKSSSYVSPNLSTQCIDSIFKQDMKFADSSDSCHACYDRQTLMDISNYPLTLSEEMQKRISDIGIARASNVVIFAPKRSDSSGVLKVDDVIKSNKVEIPDVVIEQNKFVPSLQKTKRISDMRDDLSVDEATRKQYASSKFDMSRYPFLRCNQMIGQKQEQQKEQEQSATKDSISVKDVGAVPELLDTNNRLKYSRKDLIAIQRRISGKAWLSYAKSRYDTSEEPFQLDQNMRCSIIEQIRQKRILEKKQRAEVIKSRLMAQQRKPKLLASARYYTKTPVFETCFDSFYGRIKKEFLEYQERRDEDFRTLGSVVPARDPPELWASKVNNYAKWLRAFDSTFMYDVYKEQGKKCEVATEVDFEEHDDLAQRLDVEAENQQSPGSSSEYENRSSVHSQRSDEIEKRSIYVLQRSPPVPILRSLDDEKKVCMSAKSDTISNTESDESDEKLYNDEVLSICSEFDDDTAYISSIAENYRRNVDFQITFSSYLWMLRAKYC